MERAGRVAGLGIIRVRTSWTVLAQAGPFGWGWADPERQCAFIIRFGAATRASRRLCHVRMIAAI